MDFKYMEENGLIDPSYADKFKEINEEDFWADMDSVIKEIINFDMLTDEQRIKAIDLAKTGYLAPTKYIHEVTGMSIKCSKIYYDMYIRPTLI